MDITEMKKALFEGGIVGAGGAGFPTHAKLSGQADTIILNCAECEPLIKVDRQLMTEYVEEVLSGMQTLVDTLEAKEGIIAIKKSYVSSIEAVNSCINNYKSLRLHILPDIYPAGDEVVLIYETTGRIVPQGKIPILVGCIVVNVETVLNIYRKLTEDKDVITKYVTVAGLVNNPITAEVPVGTSVKRLIELAGGTTTEDFVMIMGGPMTGRICNQYDLVSKTTKAVLVLPPNSPPVTKRQSTTKSNLKAAMSACSQCSMCTSLCPRNLLGAAIKPHEFMRAISNGITYNVDPFLNTFFCVSCGLCEMYSCHQGLSPRSLLDEYRNGLRAKGVKAPERENKPVNTLREERKVPEHRLLNRLGLAKFDLAAPMTCDTDVKEVKLLLRQCIGAPCSASVKAGDKVTEGQIIGMPKEGELGVYLHASITGTVTAVNDSFIAIAR
ncbi:4Fe-4S dicluster domain-containing protein [Konateibacter massiliensis]|uniref:4Fe-4S dicluster domain-containing protein n=1 Tax=Konateibacter massiliensis TaxID=2002841 RepID=UPI000C146DBB|nr:4Fe-4S dicluster domain-containing protein [Konateibacter massiliensis]